MPRGGRLTSRAMATSKKGLRAPVLPREPPSRALASLDGAELEQCRLDDCALGGQAAAHVRFDGVKVLGGTMGGTKLAHVSWLDVLCERCDLSLIDWRRAKLARVEIRECRVTGAALREAELDSVRFVDCHLDYAAFARARFEQVSFEACRLKEADFSGADLSGASFVRCDLSGADCCDTS